jgi:hypothetical protein
VAEYKVPQNVEAEDKLLGPFSFRQFVYLMIAGAAGAAMFFMGRASIILAIIPAPVFFFFGILALPLRKDQPMETYLAAMIRFWFKPRQRLWDPDGSESWIEISNPVIDKEPELKNISGQEITQRLSFLSNVEDTQGWSTRGGAAPINNTSLNDDLAADAAKATDYLDDDSSLSQNISDQMSKAESKRRDAVVNQMQSTIDQQNQPTPQLSSWPPKNSAQLAAGSAADFVNFPDYNPYPTQIQQTVVQPLSMAPAPTGSTATTSTPTAAAPVVPASTPSVSAAPAATDDATSTDQPATTKPADDDLKPADDHNPVDDLALIARDIAQNSTADEPTNKKSPDEERALETDAAELDLKNNDDSNSTETETTETTTYDAATNADKPDIISDEGANDKEEVIDHDAAADSDEEVTIALH